MNPFLTCQYITLSCAQQTMKAFLYAGQCAKSRQVLLVTQNVWTILQQNYSKAQFKEVVHEKMKVMRHCVTQILLQDPLISFPFQPGSNWKTTTFCQWFAVKFLLSTSIRINYQPAAQQPVQITLKHICNLMAPVSQDQRGNNLLAGKILIIPM